MAARIAVLTAAYPCGPFYCLEWARSATAARVAAAHLQRLAREPVNLEPQPVPMLLLGDAQDEGVAATAALHGLAAAPHTDAAALAWVSARF